MVTKTALAKELISLAESHNATIGSLEELTSSEYTIKQLQTLIATYQQETEQPTPPETTNTSQPTPAKGLMTFGDTMIDTATGETTQLEAIPEIEDLSDKIGYIQAQGLNRISFPSEIKQVNKGLYHHPVNCKHQQQQLAKGHQYHLELLGCSLTNKFDGESIDNFVLDTDWISWFKTQGAALIGQFSRLARDSEFVKGYLAFVESLKK